MTWNRSGLSHRRNRQDVEPFAQRAVLSEYSHDSDDRFRIGEHVCLRHAGRLYGDSHE